MMKSPYDEFPHIIADQITLRKIVPNDLDCLFEIYSNEKLFQYSPNMLKKTKNAVANIIGHFERDYIKKKCINLGIILNDAPDTLVGVAEMFDYDAKVNKITIGYRLNDCYWGKGIATEAVKAMTDYLFNDCEINRIQAFVMPENEKSLNVLRRNNFTEEGLVRQGHYWKGLGIVDLILFSMLKTDI